MAIPTTRTKENAEIRISTLLCNGCGRCVSVCKDFSLQLLNGKVTTTDNPFFGCIGCGHCMTICQTGAIEIFGRTCSPADLFTLPAKEQRAQYGEVFNLLRSRRSIREFTNQPVSQELIDKIMDVALTAPMGLPPSDVNVLILDSKEKVRAFSRDFCEYLEKMRWIVSNWFLTLMKPVWGKSNDALFRQFVKPLFSIYIENMKNGQDMVIYDAPLAIYFYGSPYADPADPVIAANYAMIAGESLGLGTCMLGGVHPLIQNGKKAKKFRYNHGIKYPSREGIIVIFGHPKVKYTKGIKRTFASVTYSN